MQHPLHAIVQSALASAHLPAQETIPLTRALQSRGDYASSIALGLAKTVQQSPIEVAELIATELKKNPAIEQIEVAGPGFINITMTDQWLEQEMARPLHTPPLLQDKRFIIEYSSPNIAKPMHLGHLRNTILGQTLVNLFEKAGAEVIAWSHPGDWGVQFGKLILGWQKWGDEAALSKNPIDELLRVYVKFHQEEKNDPALEQRGKETFKALQDGDPELQRLWERFSHLSMEEFDQMYQMLGVHFDIWRGESVYNNQLHPLVADAIKHGAAIESDGAIIIPLDELNLPPVLIQKSDGATLYATADLVSLPARAREFHPDEMIYVVGPEQSLHLKQVFAAALKLQQVGVYGGDLTLPKLVHISYGYFRLTTGKMSTRKGELIRLDAVLEQAIEQAESMLKEKSPNLPQQQRHVLAKTIGVGAVKYTDLMHDRNTDVVFDWEQIFSLDGNSIVYLLYTNARCNSLLENARAVSDDKKIAGAKEGWSDNERQLFLTILERYEAIAKSINTYDPHHLIDHVYGVASAFSRFYNTDPILKAPTVVRERRLQLVKLVQTELQFLFELLNIQAPDRL